MKEILIALIVSVAYPLGTVLYYFTRDELIFKRVGKALRKASYLCAVVMSVLTFTLVYYKMLEWAAALFIIILIKSAFSSIGLKGKPAMKRSLIQLFIFLIFWFALYLLV